MFKFARGVFAMHSQETIDTPIPLTMRVPQHNVNEKPVHVELIETTKQRFLTTIKCLGLDAGWMFTVNKGKTRWVGVATNEQCKSVICYATTEEACAAKLLGKVLEYIEEEAQ